MLFGRKREDEEFDLGVIDKPTQLPSFPEIEEPRAPEPVMETPVVKPKPKPVEHQIEVTGLQTDRPHMFIKIEKYNEVLEQIDELKKTVKEIDEDNSILSKINTEERTRVDELKATTKRARDLVDFFASTFTEVKS